MGRAFFFKRRGGCWVGVRFEGDKGCLGLRDEEWGIEEGMGRSQWDGGVRNREQEGAGHILTALSFSLSPARLNNQSLRYPRPKFEIDTLRTHNKEQNRRERVRQRIHQPRPTRPIYIRPPTSQAHIPPTSFPNPPPLSHPHPRPGSQGYSYNRRTRCLHAA